MLRNMIFCFCTNSIKGTLQKWNGIFIFRVNSRNPSDPPTPLPLPSWLVLTPHPPLPNSPLLGLCLPLSTHRPTDPKWRRKKEGGGERRDEGGCKRGKEKGRGTWEHETIKSDEGGEGFKNEMH